MLTCLGLSSKVLDMTKKGKAYVLYNRENNVTLSSYKLFTVYLLKQMNWYINGIQGVKDKPLKVSDFALITKKTEEEIQTKGLLKWVDPFWEINDD